MYISCENVHIHRNMNTKKYLSYKDVIMKVKMEQKSERLGTAKDKDR